MFAAVLKLIANKADSVQVNSHGELLIFLLHLPVTGTFLGQGLVIKSQRQHDICPDFPSVECAVKTPELHCVMPVKKAMEIQEMIAAVVIVLITVFPITLMDGV